MALTTIFTGHTLDLKEILAVSAPMQEISHTTANIYIEIYLRPSAIITHVHFKENARNKDTDWDRALEDLIQKREKLIEAWKQATTYICAHVTDDTQPEYKHSERFRPMKKGGEG